MGIGMPARRAAQAAIAWLALCAGLASCARKPDDALRIGAAASLREPLERIAVRFLEADPAARVELSFGASSALAAQLRAGAPLDVLLCADEEIARALESEGFATGLRAFASNRLVVIASAEAAPRVTRPADLIGPALRRVALPGPAVPAGRYARQWLSRQGLAEAVERRAAQTEDARATLQAVESGNADAAIVYATDARIARSARVAFEIPDAEQPRIAYVALLARDTQQPERAARFVDFLAGAEAARALREAGFGAPGAASSP